MSTSESKQIYNEAKEALASASYPPRKLALLHTGIAAAASFATALLSYLLSSGIGDTGGLSGIGLRSGLETVQTLLTALISVLEPFWMLGFIAAALLLARRKNPTPKTLLRGFAYWGPALRMLLLEGLLYFAAVFVSFQIGSFLYMMTPLSAQFNELLAQLNASDALDADALNQLMAAMDSAALLRLFWSMAPFMLLPMLVAIVVLSYRLRLAQFLLMDMPQNGALFAIVTSFKLTRHNCLRLVKLDLRFWWFYALEVVVQVLCYGDLLLPLLGVELSMNAVLASFLFYALALIAQVGLYVWKKPRIFASYALFYDQLLPRQETENA